MQSVDFSRFLVTAFLTFINYSAFAALPAPDVATDPVLGLRYETARVRFDPLPKHAIANCEYMNDEPGWKSVWFIHAQAQDSSGEIYYVIGGYDIGSNAAGAQKFFTNVYGLIVVTDRGTCITLDETRQTFEAKPFNGEIKRPVRKLLATDYARRLERAFGGAEQLRTEMRNQYVDKDTLSLDMQRALKAYLPR